MSAPAALLRLAAFAVLGLAGLSAVAVSPAWAAAPQRIVSLNVCADQLLMLLAPPDRIAAVSYLARDPEVSALATEAGALPITYGRLEEVLTLKPDLVLAGRFTTRSTVLGLQRFGIPVLELPPAQSFAEIRANLRHLGRVLQIPQEAEAAVAAFDARLAAVPRGGAQRPLAAVYDVNGWSAPPGSLRAAVLEAAGLDNVGDETRIGPRAQLSLEALVAAQPDLIVKSQRAPQAPALAEALLEHPVLRVLQARAEVVAVPQALWSCGTPLVAEAVTRLAEAAAEIPR